MASRAMQTAADVREKLFTIRMNDDETARLEMLADHYGLTAAGVVRMLLKREADAIAAQRAMAAAAPPPPPPPSRPRPRSKKR